MNRMIFRHGVRVLACVLTLSFAAWAAADDVAAPAAISMHMNSIHPRDVLAELCNQTGASVQVWPDNLYDQQRGPGNMLPQSMDVNVEAATFWETLDAICSAANLYPQNMGNNNSAVTLQEASGRRIFGPRPKYAGPFATIVADSIVRNHSISLDVDDPKPTHQCSVQISAYVDPRARVIKCQSSPVIETAIDDRNESIAVNPPASGQPNQNDVSCPWKIENLSIPIEYDPQTSHRLTFLKGSITATAITEVGKIEFPDLSAAAGTEKEAGGVRVQVEEVKEAEKSLDVKIIITRTEMPKESFRLLFGKIFQEGRFLSAGGKETHPSGGGGGDDGRLSYTLNANWQDDADKPVKLIWEFGTQTGQIDLPFEFHDLTLP